MERWVLANAELDTWTTWAQNLRKADDTQLTRELAIPVAVQGFAVEWASEHPDVRDGPTGKKGAAWRDSRSIGLMITLLHRDAGGGDQSHHPGDDVGSTLVLSRADQASSESAGHRDGGRNRGRMGSCAFAVDNLSTRSEPQSRDTRGCG
jgi:hypothetical protein